MNEAEVTNYKAVLLALREEMVRRSHKREDLVIVQCHEQIETVQMAGDREFAARTLERETKNLAQIRAALKRIDDGEYGICVDCEEPISAKRLRAVPWATYCVHCQELQDARETMSDFEPSLAA